MADISSVWHRELTTEQTDQLGQLFDAEYGTDEGPWNPDAPSGYAPAELHVMAVEGGRVVGHVGTQRRMIFVGDREVLVAGTGGVLVTGTGGVLVSPSHRGQGCGARLLAAAQHAARSIAPADYGYLGCREEPVPFYESCGYKRIEVTERYLPRDGSTKRSKKQAPR